MRREGVFMDRFEVSNYMIISVIRWLSASAPISIKSVLQNVRIYHRVHHFSSMTPISSAPIVFHGSVLFYQIIHVPITVTMTV